LGLPRRRPQPFLRARHPVLPRPGRPRLRTHLELARGPHGAPDHRLLHPRRAPAHRSRRAPAARARPLTERLPVLVVGDVHGDLERLFSGVKRYPPDAWRTIFLGDLVDGGPFGVGALRYAHDRPHSTVLLGNHEVLMLAALGARAER